MPVLVVGAGAIGGAVAGRLARAGRAPVVIDTDAATVERLCDPGLHLFGVEGDATIALDAREPADAPRGPFDFVLLAVRAGYTEAALGPFAASLAPGGAVVSLQNGVQLDRIAALVGTARAIGVAVGLGVTWHEPGEVELTAVGPLVVGSEGAPDDVVDAACKLLALAFPVRRTRDVRAALWGKVLVNSVTVLGAVGGMLTGAVLSDPAGRRLARAVVAEGAAVARAGGVAVRHPLADPATVDAALDTMARDFATVKSVTWRDLERGRATEVDAVTGLVVAEGAAAGIATPASAVVLDALRRLEVGELDPDSSLLAGSVARAGVTGA